MEDGRERARIELLETTHGVFLPSDVRGVYLLADDSPLASPALYVDVQIILSDAEFAQLGPHAQRERVCFPILFFRSISRPSQRIVRKLSKRLAGTVRRAMEAERTKQARLDATANKDHEPFLHSARRRKPRVGFRSFLFLFF